MVKQAGILAGIPATFLGGILLALGATSEPILGSIWSVVVVAVLVGSWRTALLLTREMFEDLAPVA